jgi:DNA-binding transcriptional LysR family regulator
MDVNDILVFVRVAQAGSFSKASKLLGMPVSTVSRRVAELESQLGIPLLLRTTRSLKVTDLGKAYLEHGQAIASELEKAQAIVSSLQSIPQGTLKITTTPDFGNFFLGKLISEFLKAHPRVRAEVVLTERVVDLIGEGFDLAIRMGELADSSLIARRIGNIDMQLYASPEFLSKRGEPKNCKELSNFECILFTGDEETHQWKLKGPKNETIVQVTSRVLSNDMALIRELAISGQGIALMPHFLCTEDVKQGRLRIVLKDWIQATDPIHVVYPGQRFLLPKVRVFVEHLIRACSNIQWRYSSNS